MAKSADEKVDLFSLDRLYFRKPFPEEYKKLKFNPLPDTIPLFLHPNVLCGDRYSCIRDDDTSKKYDHEIIFKGFEFSVDGGSFRKIDDPQNIPFVQSLVDSTCPDEFHQPGQHFIEIDRESTMSFDEIRAFNNRIVRREDIGIYYKRVDLIGEDGVLIAVELIGNVNQMMEDGDGILKYIVNFLSTAIMPVYQTDFGWANPKKSESISISGT